MLLLSSPYYVPHPCPAEETTTANYDNNNQGRYYRWHPFLSRRCITQFYAYMKHGFEIACGFFLDKNSQKDTLVGPDSA